MSRLPAPLLALAALVFAAFAAFAQSDDPAEQIVRSIYEAGPMREEEPFTARLRALLEAARARSEELAQPVAGLDFDYAINGQDFADDTYESVRYERLKRTDTTAEIKVTLDNGGRQTLVYSVLLEGDVWRVDEVRSTGGRGWTLSKLYEEGAATR
ncbi:MAG: hypothetical protein AB7L41_08380 [Flavobacteriaceae bacterium]